MRHRAIFLLLVLIALPCLSIAKSTKTTTTTKSSKPAAVKTSTPSSAKSGSGTMNSGTTNSGTMNSGTMNSGTMNSGENSGSSNAASPEVSNPPMMMSAPPTTESTIGKVIDFIEKTVKETILPSDKDAYNQLMGGVSPTMGPPGTSIEANGSGGDTTTGIVVDLEDLLNPLAQSLYLLIDSLLRTYKHKALPCVITSWIPLEGTCTPLTSSKDTNMPVPASSGPEPTR